MQDQPAIHLFKTMNNYYIYDLNTDMIIKTNKDVYSYLNRNNLQEEPDDEKIKKSIDFLKSQGYLSSHTVKKVEHSDSEMLKFHLSRKIQMLTLQVTQNCNLRCKYCVYSGNYNNRSHRKVNMSFDTAKRGIDYLIEHSVDSKQVALGFYGGEPLLVFDLIKKCILYAEEKGEGKKITFNLTSNGTLLSDEMVRFFVEHDVHVSISLDGPKEIHNKNRGFANSEKGSFDILMENLHRVEEKYPSFYKTNILIHTVIDPQNDFDCVNEYFASTEMLSNSIISSSLISDVNIKNRYDIPDDFVAKFNYEKFKIFLFMMKRLDLKYVSKLLLASFENIKRKRAYKQNAYNFVLPDTAHHGGPCIAGAQRPFLNAEGNFYPCERCNEESEAMKIGNIDDGIDPQKALKLINVGKVSEDRCKKCWAFIYCGICAAQADDGKTLSDDLIKQRCGNVRASTENMLKDYCTLRELGYDFESQTPNTKFIEMD
jgi:uncharacterized protein